MNDDTNTPRSEGDAYGAPMEPLAPEAGEADATLETAAAVQPTPDPVGGDPGSSDSWQPSWKTWVAVGVGAAAIGAAAVFGINAATSSDSSDAAVSTEAPASGATGGTGTQSPGAQRGFAGGPGGFGTIATIDGSSLTIEDASGTTTKVVTTDDTTVTVSVEGEVDDIAVGDTVMVVGEGTSTIAATRITSSGEVSDAEQGPPGGMIRNGTPPQMPDGQAPPGGMNGTPPQMPDGQAPPNGQGPGGAGMGVRGVVKSVGDGTLIVTGMDDTEVTVTTSSSTEVTITKAATLGDLEVGDSVIVIGTEADGTLTATSIREGALGGPPGMVPGAGSTSGNDSQQ